MAEIRGLTISEAEYALEPKGTGKIAVFIYAGTSDPRKVLDLAVRQYVGTNSYFELIDANLDNPWMRVVLSDINEIHQEPYDTKKHQLKQVNR